MTDELITPITQMHVHGIEFKKKIGYNTDILKIKMLILRHFGTPSPKKNAPLPLDILGYAPASYTQFHYNIIIIKLNLI